MTPTSLATMFSSIVRLIDLTPVRDKKNKSSPTWAIEPCDTQPVEAEIVLILNVEAAGVDAPLVAGTGAVSTT